MQGIRLIGEVGYNRLITLCVLILLSVMGYTQDSPAAQGLEPEAISLQDQFVLSNVPLLELPDEYKGPKCSIAAILHR